MTDEEKLVRFGVAMEPGLLREFDRVVKARGSTRSEALRDLARGAVSRAHQGPGVPAVAAITLVYDHHIRDLTERLTEIQHDFGEGVRSTLHVHLDHDHCLEVIVVRGQSDDLQRIADQILGMRGVTHGGIEIIADSALLGRHSHPHPAARGSMPHHGSAHGRGSRSAGGRRGARQADSARSSPSRQRSRTATKTTRSRNR